MSNLLSKLIRLSRERNSPIVIYDAQADTAAVLMDFSVYEQECLESLDDMDEDLEFDSDEACEDELIDDFEELAVSEFDSQETEPRDIAEQTNEEVALWRSKREEKEREEIAKALEEELQENPPPDPFEEDFVRSSEWHTLQDMVASAIPPEESSLPKEPSYHPVLNSGGSLSWSDWSNMQTIRPIEHKSIPDIILVEERESLPEIETEEPIFLEEPV